MVSSVWARNGVVLPQFRRWSNARAKLLSIMRALYKWRKFISVLAIVVVIGVIVTLTFGVHIPYLNDSNTRGTVNPSSVTTCDPFLTQSDPLFTRCPSFLANYSGEKNGSIDTNEFNVYTGVAPANQEAEYYTDNSANLRVENGSLWLEALNQPDHGYSYTSARVDTQGKENFLYGKIVVRAVMPDGVGTWPAIWMLPSQPRYEYLSPPSDTARFLNDGEIDIAESIGTQPHVVYGVAHSLAYPSDGANRDYYSTITIPNDNTTYHDYEVDWTPTSITFSIDGQSYYTYSKKPGATWQSWPFNQPFYLVMNLAIGGSWAGSDTAQYPGDGVDKSVLPTALKVQSVNYYSYIGQQ